METEKSKNANGITQVQNEQIHCDGVEKKVNFLIQCHHYNWSISGN